MSRRGLLVVAALLGLAPLALPPREPPATPGLALLGPLAEVAAQVQWLRFHAARLAGEEARALELAESALAFDPRASSGWQALAAHLALDLASQEREPSLARRRDWFRAGLAVLARGVERSSAPAELELFRAALCLAKASGDPGLDPQGAPGLTRTALEALEHAALLGREDARELAVQLRAEGVERP